LFQVTLFFVVFLAKDVQEEFGFIAWRIKIIVATLALGSQPRQGLARLWAKKKPGNERKCEGMNPHTPKRASTLGVWSPGVLLNLQKAITRLKT
jgi:hypothetical protein